MPITGTSQSDVLTGSVLPDVVLGNQGNDTLFGGMGADSLRGGKGEDSLLGGAGNDTLQGDLGNDTLHGGKGDDALSGGEGSDTLYGEAGTDTLTGGAGTDTFLITTASGISIISDFASGDHIDLRQFAVASASDVSFTQDGQDIVFEAGSGKTVRLLDMVDSGTTFAQAVMQARAGLLTNAAVNTVPIVALPLSDRSALVNSAFSYQFLSGSFTDADNNMLTYTATKSDGTALPAWLTFTAGTRTFSGTPAGGDIGALTVKVTANDGHGGTVSDTFTITTAAAPSAAADLSALNGTMGFRVDGVAAGDAAGWSLSGAGDMNGDGYGDLIVGAWAADPHGASSGSSYVVFGKAAGWAATNALSALDGTTGFRLDGPAAGDFTGLPVSNAGDVNGDGLADIIIGAYGSDPHGASSGSAYVVFGKASGWAATTNLSTLDGITGFRLDGVAAGDYAGASVGSAGDMNGDGLDDMLIGATFADPHGGSSGSTYVVFGKANGWAATNDLSSLDGTTGFRLDGAAMGDSAGTTGQGTGDINGDGFDDALIGATADPHGADSGSVYVVFGKAAGWAAASDLSSLNGTTGFRLDGVAAGDFAKVVAQGDVNGDGLDDVIIGAFGADPHGADSGSAYVIFGKANGWAASTNLSTVDGITGFRLDGAVAGDKAGKGVATGDINADGLQDIVISAAYADPHGNQSGSIYVVFGKAAGWAATSDLSTLDGTTGFRLDGVAATDYAGGDVKSMDINGDGFDDVIIGAAGADPHGNGSGSSYVVFGSNSNGAVTNLGTSGADSLTGSGDTDVMNGARGNDLIRGGKAADVIKGASGDDTLAGGEGNDKLWGGTGADHFLYSAATQSGSGSGSRDIIYDFKHTDGDKIDLSAFHGTLSFIGTAAFSADPLTPEVRYTATGTLTVVQVDTIGDGTANFEIELHGVHSLVAGDFVL